MKLVCVGLVFLAVISAPAFAMPSFLTEYKGQSVYTSTTTLSFNNQCSPLASKIQSIMILQPLSSSFKWQNYNIIIAICKFTFVDSSFTYFS